MFGFLGLILGFIEDGITAAVAATVAFLEWAVGALWAYALSVYNGLVQLGSHVLEGFQKAWDFFKNTYEDVLKPALGKLATLFERVKAWLNDTFGPVLRFLRTVRSYILDFYTHWIRPVLDAIDETRQILKILEALHIAWAQTLDNILGTVEDTVNQAFLDVLGPLNKVIGIVNGVITGNLLFQHVPYLRTLERDMLQVQRMLVASRQHTLTGDELHQIKKSAKTPTVPEVLDDVGVYLKDGDSNFIGPLVTEQAAVWADLLGVDNPDGAAANG